MADARAWGESTARDLALFRQGKLLWRDIDPGCVLHGPPGTGKTTFAKALAATCGLPLVSTSFGVWQGSGDGHLGSTLAAMQAAFKDAIARAPSILFIDELDSIPARGTTPRNADYWNQVTNALLKEFDKLSEHPGVIVVGACNHPSMLDPALVRSGRMDRMIAVTLPTVKELEAILRFHLTDAEVARLEASGSNVFARVAHFCAGMSGADVARIVREVRRHARASGKTVSLASFEAVLDPKTVARDREAEERIAVHEAGHVIVMLRTGIASELTASIAARNMTAGRVVTRRNSRPRTPAVFAAEVMSLLAGHVAEAMFFDSPSDMSGGASKDCDLAQATRIATDIVARHGLHMDAGLIWYAPGEAMPESLRDTVKELLAEAYNEARRMLEEGGDLLEDIAEALLARRVLTHADIIAIVKAQPENGLSGEPSARRTIVPAAPKDAEARSHRYPVPPWEPVKAERRIQ
jgi:ATP-dependent Zn protease